MHALDTFCSRCGTQYRDITHYPRLCTGCGARKWLNPAPVGVAVLPVQDEKRIGILCIRRGIEPQKGKLALPGGFLVVGETWQEGLARELKEETGLIYDPNQATIINAFSSANNNLILFASFPMILKNIINFDYIDEEIMGIEVIYEPIELAFSSHTDIMKSYFDSQKNGITI